MRPEECDASESAFAFRPQGYVIMASRNSARVNAAACTLGILLAGIAVAAGSAPGEARAAQLDAVINPNEETSEFRVTYQRTALVTYGEEGSVGEMLRGGSWTYAASGSSANDTDVAAFRDALNAKIAADGSGARIAEMSVEYAADMRGRQTNAAIDYKLVISGELADYNIAKAGGVSGQTLVDLGWRGLSVGGPVEIGGVEVNVPMSAIAENEPELRAQMRGSEAEEVLSTPLVNAEAIRDQPLANWHFLFDPTGIGADAGTFGLSDTIKGFVLSAYTMGESSLREGRQVEVELHGGFSSDKEYDVRTVQSSDSATLRVIGLAVIDSLGDLEIVGVTPTAPEGYGQTATGDFPVAIIYGMAGLAAVGGGAFFVFSSRQLKKEAGQGQTGIDPARLTGYQTSASAGGYRTNRGEAQLADDTDYRQTRSVYDAAEAQPPRQAPPPAAAAPAAAAPAEDAACGCAASADSGNECDCQMQAHCLCDAACGCGSPVCAEAVRDM